MRYFKQKFEEEKWKHFSLEREFYHLYLIGNQAGWEENIDWQINSDESYLHQFPFRFITIYFPFTSNIKV